MQIGFLKNEVVLFKKIKLWQKLKKQKITHIADFHNVLRAL